MTAVRVSERIRALLETQVDSFDKLEIVLVLAETPSEAISRRAVAERLELPADELSACLDELAASGLLVVTPVAVGPADARASESLGMLRDAYRDDTLGVVQVLSDVAMRRIRGMAAHAFARAFDLRGRKKGPRS